MGVSTTFFSLAASRKRLHTEEEMALKKSEITRRRKNQSAQRAEQDKLETINRLLKKQAGKRKKGAVDDDEGGDDKKTGDKDAGSGRANRYMTPTSYLRVNYTVHGTTLSIPEESLEHMPAWMQQSVPQSAMEGVEANGSPIKEHVKIEMIETSAAKEPSYPAPRGKCAVLQCNIPWKYRGPKSKKVACGLEHLKLIEGTS